MYVFCLSCPCATFALQRGSFVPREWLAVKGLFTSRKADFEKTNKQTNKQNPRLFCNLFSESFFWNSQLCPMILFTFQMDNILRFTRLFGPDIFQGFDKSARMIMN